MNSPEPFTAPMRALLLRVGTGDRVALAQVFDIRATQNAETAVRTLADFAADVVIAGVGISDRETMALLRILRDPAASPRKGLPVICLLSESSPAMLRDLIKAGVDHVMIQPVSAGGLRDLARHLCDNPMPQITVPSYVGPDRRRLPDDSYTGPGRRDGE